MDTLEQLLTLKVTATDQGDREQVAALAEEVQQVTDSTVELTYVDQGYTGPNAAEAAKQLGIRLEVAKHPMANAASCSCLAARSWERSFAWPQVYRVRRVERRNQRPVVFTGFL